MEADEKSYNIVAQELKSGIIRDGLWVKALSKSFGDEGIAKSLYIEWRVNQLIENEKSIKREEENKIKLREQKEREGILDEYLSARQKLSEDFDKGKN